MAIIVYGLVKPAILLALVCADVAAVTYSDYSRSRMPQYAEYEGPRDSVAVDDDYRDHASETTVDYKYDDETHDKSEVNPGKNHEIEEWRKQPSHFQKENKKSWANENLDSPNDHTDESVTKYRQNYYHSNRPRSRDKKRPRLNENKYQRNDDSNVDDDSESQEELYYNKPQLGLEKYKSTVPNSRKSTDKIIRRKPRDRFVKPELSDIEERRPIFDIEEINNLRPDNLLQEGALVPMPVKLNPEYDYYDLKRLKSKDKKNPLNQRTNAAVSAVEVDRRRPLLPSRRKEFDLDNYDEYSMQKQPPQSKLKSSNLAQKDTSDDEYVKKYITARLKEQEALRAEMKKTNNFTNLDMSPSDNMFSDLDDVDRHLGRELEQNRIADDDYKSRDLNYKDKDEFLKQERKEVDSTLKDSILTTKGYKTINILTRTRPSYRRKDDDYSEVSRTSITVLVGEHPTPKLRSKANFGDNTETTETTKTASTELSLAEKSRLSILKKVMRKENVNSKTTKKPPVLMQVNQGMNTMVMVEPPSTMDPWLRAKEVSGDTEERLKQVKRLMRHKLVSSAKNMKELTDNWDEVICDYIDMSVLDNHSLIHKGNAFLVLGSYLLSQNFGKTC